MIKTGMYQIEMKTGKLVQGFVTAFNQDAIDGNRYITLRVRNGKMVRIPFYQVKDYWQVTELFLVH